MIHTPVDLDAESKLDADLKCWMAFAKQKLSEVATLAAAARNGKKSVEEFKEGKELGIDTRPVLIGFDTMERNVV